MFKLIASIMTVVVLTSPTFARDSHGGFKIRGTTVTVDSDFGGPVFPRILEVEKLLKDKTNVEIRGNCWSSCTLYTKLMETNQFCVYPSASLHFHAPYRIIDGKVVLAPEAYQSWYLQQYPNLVHMILASNGGLTSEWIHLAGKDILDYFPNCLDKKD
jgi:hypothetical protein